MSGDQQQQRLRKSSPLRMTPSDLSDFSMQSSPQRKKYLNPGSTSTLSASSPLFQRDSVVRHQLQQIDAFLDIKRLVSDIQTQNNDSYALRTLLAKLKSQCQTLIKIDSQYTHAFNQIKLDQIKEKPLVFDDNAVLKSKLEALEQQNQSLRLKNDDLTKKLKLIQEQKHQYEDSLTERDQALIAREQRALDTHDRLQQWESHLNDQTSEIHSKLTDLETYQIEDPVLHYNKSDYDKDRFSDLKALIEQKLKQIQDREMAFNLKVQKLQVFLNNFEKREQYIKQKEAVLNEKEEQLYRGYDKVTHMLNTFEKDKQIHELRKKQVFDVEKRLNSLIDQSAGGGPHKINA